MVYITVKYVIHGRKKISLVQRVKHILHDHIAEVYSSQLYTLITNCGSFPRYFEEKAINCISLVKPHIFQNIASSV
jgi:hypothetical protein